MEPTKILVVDDSALYRQLINNVLRKIPRAAVVGLAKNGVDALEKIEQLDPDLLTLDVQMPDMDGIQVLREIKRRGLRPQSIMISSFTAEGAQVTTDALMEGAFDFILKPSSGDSGANRQQLHDSLEEKIAAFSEGVRHHQRARQGVRGRRGPDEAIEVACAPSSACRAVVIGASTGGPAALKALLPNLPGDLAVPVLVVQHMPAQYTRSLAARMDEICQLEVIEASDGVEAKAGRVIVAAGGRQMKLEDAGERLVVRVSDDPPEHGTRPSLDYLLRSAADVLQGRILSVIMTGMGRDGLAGCQQLKQSGGFVFAQHEDDCVVYGMPKAVVENNLADRVIPLGKIALAIVVHVKRSSRTSSDR